MAGRYNIILKQGTTFNLPFTVKSGGSLINLTSYTARMQVRTSAESTATLLSLTNGSGITLGGAAGTVSIDITATQTAALPVGKHVWDIELVSAGGQVLSPLEGKFIVTAEVTR